MANIVITHSLGRSQFKGQLAVICPPLLPNSVSGSLQNEWLVGNWMGQNCKLKPTFWLSAVPCEHILACLQGRIWHHNDRWLQLLGIYYSAACDVGSIVASPSPCCLKRHVSQQSFCRSLLVSSGSGEKGVKEGVECFMTWSTSPETVKACLHYKMLTIFEKVGSIKLAGANCD